MKPPPVAAVPHRQGWGRWLTVAVAGVLLAGCATGKGATVSGGSFDFVAPGGQSTIFYDPPQTRGTVHGLAGPSLLDPTHTIGVDDFPGQVVVLNVCGSCRAEAPDLEQTYTASKASGVTLLGIDVRDDRDAAADFVREQAITYPSIFDPPGRSLVALRGFPRDTVASTIVLDRAHRVAAVFLTKIRISQLLPVVQRVAAEPTHAALLSSRGFEVVDRSHVRAGRVWLSCWLSVNVSGCLAARPAAPSGPLIRLCEPSLCRARTAGRGRTPSPSEGVQ